MKTRLFTSALLLVKQTRVAIFAAFLLCSGLGVEAAQAKSYAALAVVPQHGRVYHGYAQRPSLKQAKDAALRKCANARCVVSQVYQPGQCAHLVLGNNQIFWNNDRFGRSERSRILNACRRVDDNCSVILSECLEK